jgi:hypothetical protein
MYQDLPLFSQHSTGNNDEWHWEGALSTWSVLGFLYHFLVGREGDVQRQVGGCPWDDPEEDTRHWQVWLLQEGLRLPRCFPLPKGLRYLIKFLNREWRVMKVCAFWLLLNLSSSVLEGETQGSGPFFERSGFLWPWGWCRCVAHVETQWVCVSSTGWGAPRMTLLMESGQTYTHFRSRTWDRRGRDSAMTYPV